MTDHEQSDPNEPAGANPGYVTGQLARALTTSQSHPDAATRERAQQKIERWIATLRGMLSGALRIGSRTPVANTPAWATLEVLRGGFASGALLAGGPLQPHEEALLTRLPPVEPGAERAALNSYYLSETGFAVLHEQLTDGTYRVQVPEEAALLVIAWLSSNGEGDAARSLLATLGPWLGRLRFYPVPAERPLSFNADVALRTVAQTIDDLHAVTLRPRREQEREALLVWAPLYDRAIALFQETVAGAPPSVPHDTAGIPERRPSGHYAITGGWPCQHYPDGWRERARQLLADYAAARAQHTLVAKPERAGESFAVLRDLLEQCSNAPDQLSGYDVGRIRAILAAFSLRRGMPGSPQHQALREAQHARATTPTAVDLAQALAQRLKPFPADEGLTAPEALLAPIAPAELPSDRNGAHQPLPPKLTRLVERARAAPVEELVARGIVGSSEMLAGLIPQLSARAQVNTISDPALRQLYYALYTAFRRRRSLLLLHLQHQVRFDELPWVTVLQPFVVTDASTQATARALLHQVTSLTLTTFPQQILPNPLLREITALADGAGLNLPIVEELAADIFMGAFTKKYLAAAQWAGRLMADTLYERYYAIDYAELLQMSLPHQGHQAPAFADLCFRRAGVTPGSRWSVAHNGAVIEQAQILTTHNLAVMFSALELSTTLRPQLRELAEHCFTWICSELQMQRDGRRNTLRSLKQCAYAWRQMIFFLALLPEPTAQEFGIWAEQSLAAQPITLRDRLYPALLGLQLTLYHAPITPPARRFLGWTTEEHWLMAAT